MSDIIGVNYSSEKNKDLKEVIYFKKDALENYKKSTGEIKESLNKLLFLLARITQAVRSKRNIPFGYLISDTWRNDIGSPHFEGRAIDISQYTLDGKKFVKITNTTVLVDPHWTGLVNNLKKFFDDKSSINQIITPVEVIDVRKLSEIDKKKLIDDHQDHIHISIKKQNTIQQQTTYSDGLYFYLGKGYEMYVVEKNKVLERFDGSFRMFNLTDVLSLIANPFMIVDINTITKALNIISDDLKTKIDYVIKKYSVAKQCFFYSTADERLATILETILKWYFGKNFTNLNKLGIIPSLPEYNTTTETEQNTIQPQTNITTINNNPNPFQSLIGFFQKNWWLILVIIGGIVIIFYLNEGDNKKKAKETINKHFRELKRGTDKIINNLSIDLDDDFIRRIK